MGDSRKPITVHYDDEEYLVSHWIHPRGRGLWLFDLTAGPNREIKVDQWRCANTFAAAKASAIKEARSIARIAGYRVATVKVLP